MRLIRIGGACMALAIGAMALGAGSASAALELPQVGKCAKVGFGHVYASNTCIHPAATPGAGQYEWTGVSATEKLTFTGSGGETKIKALGHMTITCIVSNIAGEYTGARTVSVTIEFQGCKDQLGEQCQSGVNKSEIKTLPLEGTWGYVKKTEKGVQVGLDLKATSPLTTLGMYECTNDKETAMIEGSVIAAVAPINKMTTEQKLKYFVTNTGHQVPESFQESAPDTLTTKFTSGLESTTAASTLSIKEEKGTNSTALEIKGSGS